MCARLLACPLCSQPGFLTLDALRAGLVSVATRPLGCPVCNEILLGIDKLTIHLFSHTISTNPASDPAKLIEVRNAQQQQQQQQQQQLQSWSILNTEPKRTEEPTSGIYIPIDEIDAFRTALKDAPTNNQSNLSTELKTPGQVIFLQSVPSTQPKIFSANIVGQNDQHDSGQLSSSLYQTTTTTTTATTNNSNNNHPAASITVTTDQNVTRQNVNDSTMCADVVITVNDVVDDDKDCREGSSYTQTTWTETNSSEQPVSNENASPGTRDFSSSHTDRLADLVKNAQITASPLGTYHEAYDCSKPNSPPTAVQIEPESTLPATSTTTITTITPTTTTTTTTAEVTEIMLSSSSPSPSSSTSLSEPKLKSVRLVPVAERNERCNICGIHFPEHSILLLHKQLVHSVNESGGKSSDNLKFYSCHLCTKVFKMRGSLMVHMRVAHPNVSGPGKTSKDLKPRELTNEQDTESADNETGYKCPTCGKHFKKEQHVVQHLKIHEGKQWECDVCSKMFTTKYFLKKHKRLHSGEMPYRCNLCDKTFTFQQSFHKHRLYHKDDKPHTCLACGRSFKELSTLHNHERIHTGEKPFACETCGKCFRQRVSYLVHRRIHTGVMPYKCTACGKHFRYKVSQRTHKCSQLQPGSALQQAGAFTQDTLETTEKPYSQKERIVKKPVVKEDNQYVIAMNDESQYMLKRKSNIESADEHENVNKNIALESKDSTNDSSDFLENLWKEDSPRRIEFNESNQKSLPMVSSIMKDEIWNNSSNSKDSSQLSKDSISKRFAGKEVNNQFANNLWCQTQNNDLNYEKSLDKNELNNTNDFFSLVMSPLENGVSSPSTEMEHLRLSSPVNNQEHPEVGNCFPTLNNSPSAVQVDCDNIENNFQSNGSNLSILQTINEDSLKELLYGIVDK